MALSLAERDVLRGAVKGYPFDVDARDAEYAEVVTKGDILARPAKTEIRQQWESRSVEVVVIGRPDPIPDIFTSRSKGLYVTIFWSSKRDLEILKASLGNRAPDVTHMRVDALAFADSFRGHVRPGHAEIDMLIIGQGAPRPAENLAKWLSVVGIGGSILAYNYGSKVPGSITRTADDMIKAGVLELVGTAGEYALFRKLAEMAAADEQ